MSRSTDPDIPRQRKPGAGRKPGFSEPVTIVSVSMDPSTLRQIDREALTAGRSRSAFVRWALRKTCAHLLQKREDAQFTHALAADDIEDSHAKYGWAKNARALWGRAAHAARISLAASFSARPAGWNSE